MTDTSATHGIWGYHEHNIDDKGRIILPQSMRAALGAEIVCMPGPDGHVRCYPKETWTRFADEAIGTDLADELNPDSILLQQVFGNCDHISPDPQSRLTIPRHLRRHGNLKEMALIAIVGAGNRLELWNLDTWENRNKVTMEQVSRAALRRKLGIHPFAALTAAGTEPLTAVETAG